MSELPEIVDVDGARYMRMDVVERDREDVRRAIMAALKKLTQVKAISEDTMRMCKDGHPVSAFNVAASIDAIIRGEP